MIKYYATCSSVTSYEEGEERDNAAIWTVSTNPDSEGWNTDCGFRGYKLTRKEAQFLADAANEKLDRENKNV